MHASARTRLWSPIVVLVLAACDGNIGSHGDGHDAAVVPDAGEPADAAAGHDAAAGLDAATLPDAAQLPDAGPSDAGGELDASVPEGYRLDDGLRGGTTGNAVGGTFGDDGWTTTDRTDRIWYVLPRLVEGSIEFTMSNVWTDTLLPSDTEIVTMYEGGWGMQEPIGYSPWYRNNHYKFMIRIYGTLEEGRVGEQKVMWGMCPSGDPGYDDCGCGSFFDETYGGDGNWDGTPQRLRIEWRDGVTRYFRNGGEVVAIDWSDSGLTFGPQELHFTLGSPRAGSVDDTGMPIGATFSDLVIEGTEGDQAFCP